MSRPNAFQLNRVRDSSNIADIGDQVDEILGHYGILWPRGSKWSHRMTYQIDAFWRRTSATSLKLPR